MKKITSLILLIVFLIAISIVPFNAVSVYIDGDYSYADIDEYNVALYAYSGESTVLTVPSQFSGRVVSEVYDYAFENNTTLTAIDFSQNDDWLNRIGIKSFAECTGFTGNLNLPSSIRTLSLGSFQGCTGLTSLTINTGLRDIPRQCFNRCTSLQDVYLPSDLETIDDLAFANCDDLNKVYIPRSVYFISDTAFARSYPTLYVYYDSYAHHYAEDKNIKYVLLDYKLGDLNDDGQIDVFDALIIQKYAVEKVTLTQKQLELGDVNHDDYVDVLDAAEIQKYAVGKAVIA